jgi:hypothetical protein
MPTIIAPDAPLSAAEGVKYADIIDEKLIHFESGHLHKWVFCCPRIALALLVVWVVAQSYSESSSFHMMPSVWGDTVSVRR